MNWRNLFEMEFVKQNSATKQEIELFLENWNKDLSSSEILEINSRQQNPFPKNSKYYELYKPFNPSLWNMPKRELPSRYIEFLMYSNGGEFQNGDRYFQFFSTNEFRQMNLEYEFPEYMEFSISFAMDGCGNHLVFDMRKAPKNGEYPILIVHSSSLGYEDCKFIGDSFIEVCMGRTFLDDELNME